MSDFTPINLLLEKFDKIVKGNDVYDPLQITLADVRLIRVYLYDLKLRMIKERDNVK